MRWRSALLAVAAIALPLILVASALRTFRALDEQRSVFLRNRAAAIAGRLEALPASAQPADLLDEEPGLVDLRVYSPGEENATLADLWEGRELFRTERATVEGEEVYRAWVPFHSSAGLRIARIDVAESAAEFLLSHARHHVIVATAAALVLLGLSVFALRSLRRELELQHLAHIGKMAAVLAHEIRNPLGTIKGFAQLAGEGAPPATKELLDPIVGEAQRLEALVHDLLLYGRPPQPAPVAATWEEIAAPLEQHARHLIAGRAIRFERSAAPLRATTDPKLLGEALLNLVRNAIEAVGEEGEVHLAATAQGSALRISVTDNGPGLDPAVRRRLFKPFQTTKADGTGLGLSIARKLIESLGGTLRLEDAAPRGARAVVDLPQARVQS